MAVWWAACLLLLLTTAARAQDQFEPNDTPQTSTVIDRTGTTLQATIHSSSDIDWFRFQQVEAGPISISMTSIPSGQDYDMELGWRDPSNGQLFSVGLSENPPPQDELISLSAQEGVAGDYFLIVYGFDGSFDASDTYELSFTFQGGTTNTPPTVSIAQPAGGEEYEAGSQQTIRYTVSDADGQNLQVTIEHSTNNGTSWQLIAQGTQQSGTFQQSWTVPSSAYSQGRIRVTANDGVAAPVTAVSNTFSVSLPPSGNNSIAVGSGSGAAGSSATVAVSLSNEDVVKGLQLDVLFDPGILSFQGATPISRAAQFSDSSRTVSSGKARIVLFPTASQTIAAGSGSILNLSFQLLAAGSSALTPTGVVLSGENGNSLNVSSTAGSMTVTGGGGNAPTIQLVSPQGGETFTGGSVVTVQYVASGGSGPLSVEIAYSSNNGGSYTTQGTDSNNSGSFLWPVPNQATSQGKIRVTASDGTRSASDESNAFSVTTSSGTNSLAIGSAEGAGGSTVSLPLTLTNSGEVKALQFDLNYTESVVTFASASVSGRGAQMVITMQRIANGRARGVLRFENANTLAPGSGEVATVRFNLVGGQGAQSTIAPTGILLSDPDANEVPNVSAQSGVVQVTSDPVGGPEVHVSVLKNPGQPRRLEIFVSIDGGSGSAPQVTVGGQVLAVSALGSGVFRGVTFVAPSLNSVTVTATDTVGGETGTDTQTVTF